MTQKEKVERLSELSATYEDISSRLINLKSRKATAITFTDDNGENIFYLSVDKEEELISRLSEGVCLVLNNRLELTSEEIKNLLSASVTD